MLAKFQSVRKIHRLLDFDPVHVLSFPNETENSFKPGPEGRAYTTAMVIAIVLFCSSSAYLTSPYARPGAAFQQRVAHHCADSGGSGDV